MRLFVRSAPGSISLAMRPNSILSRLLQSLKARLGVGKHLVAGFAVFFGRVEECAIEVLFADVNSEEHGLSPTVSVCLLCLPAWGHPSECKLTRVGGLRYCSTSCGKAGAGR